MTSSLLVAIYACAAVSAFCWLLSLLTREYSWVDRIWSIIPVFYVAWFAFASGRVDARLILMTLLVLAWGARLTFNFARKGGFSPGGEDYRWAELRRRMSPTAFALLNVFFISTAQNGLLLLMSLPAWVAAEREPAPLGALDFIAAGLFIVFLAGETVADQQQWRFHATKTEPGFLSEGLFRYSRHPNFFCEQGLWWAFYLFGVAAGAPWLNPSLAGPLLLTALFQGSTSFTESITAAKYPGYADYRRRTSRLMPWFPGSR
jgi:steroid 5-alpha reductase family enzyme